MTYSKNCGNPKCNKVFTVLDTERNVKYCPDCRKNHIVQKMYDLKHEGRLLGNPQDDTRILEFLKQKRIREDLDYKNSLLFPKIKDRKYQENVAKELEED